MSSLVGGLFFNVTRTHFCFIIIIIIIMGGGEEEEEEEEEKAKDNNNPFLGKLRAVGCVEGRDASGTVENAVRRRVVPAVRSHRRVSIHAAQKPPGFF